MPPSLGEMVDATQALTHLDLADRELLRAVLASCLTKKATLRDRFDRCFDAAFPLSRPAASPDSPGPIPLRSPAEFHDELQAALSDGDRKRMALLAGELIEQHAGLGEGRGTEKYHLYRVLRAVDLAKLLADAMALARAQGGELSALELRLLRAELSERIEELRRHLGAQIRARIGDTAPMTNARSPSTRSTFSTHPRSSGWRCARHSGRSPPSLRPRSPGVGGNDAGVDST